MLYSGSLAYPYASRCVTTAALVCHCNRHLEMVIPGRKSCSYSTTYSFATWGVVPVPLRHCARDTKIFFLTLLTIKFIGMILPSRLVIAKGFPHITSFWNLSFYHFSHLTVKLFTHTLLSYKRCWKWSSFCCGHKATRLFLFSKIFSNVRASIF
jgi:hypothetical protein